MVEHPAAVFLTAALARAEKVARAIPRGPWQWEHRPPPDGFVSLEGPAEVSVFRSRAKPGNGSWIEQHPAFDEFLPEPEAVLRRIAADRALLADLQAERHLVVDGDGWFTCGAATEERDGDHCYDETRRGGPCDCGRDERVGRRIRLLSQAWGWTEETT